MSKEDRELTGQMARSENFQQHKEYGWINENKFKKQWSGVSVRYLNINIVLTNGVYIQ